MSAQERQLADQIDRACEIEQEATAQAIYDVQRLCKQTRAPLKDGSFEDTDCEDCGLEIPIERMRVALRNNFCIHCLTLRERLRR